MDDLDGLQEKRITQDEYKQIREEKKAEKIRLKQPGVVGWIMRLPQPSKLLTLFLIILAASFLVRYYPYVIRWYVEYYGVAKPDVVSYLQWSAVGNIVSVILLYFIYTTAGSIVIPNMIAYLRKKPLLLLITKNNIIRFIVPKAVLYNVWDVVNEATMEQEPVAMYTAPNMVRYQIAVPEIAKGLDVRKLALETSTTSIDMQTYFRYGQQKKQEGRIGRQFSITEYMPYLVMFLMIGTVLAFMWPNIEKRFNQDATINTLQSDVYRCNNKLVAAGLSFEEAAPKATTTTTLEDVTVLKPAVPAVGLS